MKYLLIKANGDVKLVDLPKGIVAKRDAIGGYDVEFITLNYAMTLQICLTEAGKIYQLPRNDLATEIYRYYTEGSSDWIAGDALFCSLNSKNGNFKSISAEETTQLLSILINNGDK